jgi:hypothetical protein
MENSTPGAHIGLSMDDLQQFIESDESHKNKNFINEKINKINKILM